MRRKYRDCQRQDGNCTICSLVNYGRHCRNNPITKLEWARLSAEMTPRELASTSGVNIRQIQKVESGESEAGNMSSKNLIALANALGVDPRELI